MIYWTGSYLVHTVRSKGTNVVKGGNWNMENKLSFLEWGRKLRPWKMLQQQLMFHSQIYQPAFQGLKTWKMQPSAWSHLRFFHNCLKNACSEASPTVLCQDKCPEDCAYCPSKQVYLLRLRNKPKHWFPFLYFFGFLQKNSFRWLAKITADKVFC